MLFEIINSLGTPEELNLIKSGAKAIGVFQLNGERIRIYFQRVRGLFDLGKYKQIFDDYELDVSSRRPDIILEKGNKKKFMLVEVKRTTDRNYIVDSVYKVLGYLSDFEKYFNPQQKPKGVLVVWNIERQKKSDQEITILSHDELSSIKEML